MSVPPGWWGLRLAARLIAARSLDLRVEGLHHVPASGPALLACRHYHHLYDGCALLAAIPRPLGIVAGLDWVQHPAQRRLLELACRAAGWPVVLRPERLRADARAYRPTEIRPYLRAALRAGRATLAAGGALVMFPEGSPTIDPHASVKTDDRAIVPFRPGVLHLAERVQRQTGTLIPIIPVGLAYTRGRRWRVALRFGAPLYHRAPRQRAADLAALAATVRWLTGLEGAPRERARPTSAALTG